MGDAEDKFGIEWVVACLSPRDISPHPNFPTETASGPELMALLTELRWREFKAFRETDGKGEAANTGDVDILRATQLALRVESIVDGRVALLSIATDAHLSLGERAAAALHYAVASSDLDEPEASLTLLEELASLVMEGSVNSTPSRRLAGAVLFQQCALRSMEVQRIETARGLARQALQALETLTGDWEEFQTSSGISWSARESQQRIAEVIALNAKSLLAFSGDPIEGSWIEIVRAPTPVASVKPMGDELEGLTRIVAEVFDRNIMTTQRTQTFGKSDMAALLLYKALLNAELTGDLGAITERRELLGTVFGVRSAQPDGDEWRSEAIRLLRQGDADKLLGRVLQETRMKGPLSLLRSEAEALISARINQDFVTLSDLTLVDRAADLISTESSNMAIDLAAKYVRLERDGRVKGSRTIDWSRTEKAVKVLASLVAGNKDADVTRAVEVASDLYSSSSAAGEQFVASAMAALASNVDWREIDATAKARWVDLARAARQSPSVLTIDLLRIEQSLGLPLDPELYGRLQGHQFAAATIGELGGHPAPEAIDQAVQVVEVALQTIQQQAEQGQFSTYGYSPFSMAALLITRYQRDDLWLSLAGSLSHPLISKRDKLDALDVFVSEDEHVALPEGVKDNVRALVNRTESDAHDHLFGVSRAEYEAALRNFCLASGLLEPDEVQAVLLRDAGASESRIRLAAATGSRIAAETSALPEWPIVLLLQLSHDYDANVRNGAARQLGHLSVLQRISLKGSIADRVRSLLREPGIAMPMGAIMGMLAAARSHDDIERPLWCADVIAELSSGHPSRNIHEAARLLLMRAKGIGTA